MCLLRGTDWVFIYNSTFCPHSVFVCFVWISEQTAIISVYSINCLVFITETECLLRSTDWIFIYNSTFGPHIVFMCFVWIWEQTAIMSLCNINWMVFITETECVYCAVRTEYLKIIQVISSHWSAGRILRADVLQQATRYLSHIWPGLRHLAKNIKGTWQRFGHWLVKASRPQTSSALTPGYSTP